MVRERANEAPKPAEFRRFVFSWFCIPPTFACLLASSIAGSSFAPAQDDLRQIADAVQNGKLKEAEAALESLLKSQPNSVDAYRLLGAVFEREQKLQQAESALQRAVELSGGKDPQALFLLCQTEFELKKKTEALGLAHDLASLAGDNPQAHYALGRLLRENGVTPEAIQELATAVRLAPGNPAVTTELIVAYLDQGRSQEADALLRSFIGSASYEDLLNAGSRFGETGKSRAAGEAFERAVQLKPDSYDAAFNLGFAYYHQGNSQKALDTLNRIPPDLASNQADYHYLRGKIEAALHHQQAAGEEYLAALKLEPDNESLCSDAGLLFFHFENFWKSLDVYEKCAQRLPDSAPIETGFALTYFRLGKYDDAASTFQKVLNLRPDADAAREALAFLDYVSGHLVEAKHLLESRLNSAGADYYLYYLHALVLVRLDPIGEHSGALRSLDESLRLNPQFAPAYFQRAKLRNDAGDTSRALADLDTATRLDRTYAEPFYLIAQIDYRLGQKEQAEQARHEYTIREKEREEQQQKQLVENRLLQALQ